MDRRLRILWITPHLPRRGMSAARERWAHLLRRLATRHAVSLLAFVDPEDVGREEAVPPGLAGVHLVRKGAPEIDDPLALLPQSVRWSFAQPALRDAIAARLAAERYDIVQYEYTEMAHLMPASSAPRSILTVHQIAFAARYPEWRAGGGGVRRGAVSVYRYLQELDFELRAVRRVDRVITMSAADAARLRRFHPDLPVSVNPVGVDCTEFRPPDAPPPPDADLVFVGFFPHAPNADAARFLVRDVLPRLGRPVRLRLVGREPTPDVLALARPGTVEVTGAVDDVRPELARAAVVVVPVRFGTGMRGKLLEALATGCPVVSTSVGAEGVGATSGRELLVADDAAGFAAAVRRLLDDPDLRARLGAAARTFVGARFDWDVVAAAHDEIYADVMRVPERPPAARDRIGWLERVGRHGPRVAIGAALLVARSVRWHWRRGRSAAAS